jgi:methylated-DNA-[protein]-cysteine S-methyltransferase
MNAVVFRGDDPPYPPGHARWKANRIGHATMSTPFLPAPAATEEVAHDIVTSPLGRLLLTWVEREPGQQVLTGLHLVDGGKHAVTVPAGERREGGFPEAASQLGEYFNGERTDFELPLAPRGSEFQIAVWTALTRIPFGETASYGEVALALGKSLVASRAVGLANGRNPISIIVPCHRVIGADGSMTGYGGGLERKEWLLRHEGVLDASRGGMLW